MSKVNFSYEKYCEYVRNKMSSIFDYGEGFVLENETESLRDIVPMNIETEEEALRYIYDNRLFSELEKVLSIITEKNTLDNVFKIIEMHSDFDYNQMEQIYLGLKNKVDTNIYSKPEFNSDQMREIRIGLECGVDVSSLVDPEKSLEIEGDWELEP